MAKTVIADSSRLEILVVVRYLEAAVDHVFANAIGHANHTRVELADSAAQDRRTTAEALHEI